MFGPDLNPKEVPEMFNVKELHVLLYVHSAHTHRQDIVEGCGAFFNYKYLVDRNNGSGSKRKGTSTKVTGKNNK